jgi:tetraacyldisaccharide 4'-kinase
MSLSLTDTLPKPEQAIAVAAIANPERFTASLTGEGIRIEHKMYFSDHHFYSNTDVNMIIKECHARNASVIITTQKDAVKLVEFTDTFAAQKITVVVSCIRTNLSSSDDFFRALEQLINNGSKKNQI